MPDFFIAGCCARSGHAAAPPSSVMNSRRFIDRSAFRPPCQVKAGLQDIASAGSSQWLIPVSRGAPRASIRVARGFVVVLLLILIALARAQLAPTQDHVNAVEDIG